MNRCKDCEYWRGRKGDLQAPCTALPPQVVAMPVPVQGLGQSGRVEQGMQWQPLPIIPQVKGDTPECSLFEPSDAYIDEEEERVTHGSAGHG